MRRPEDQEAEGPVEKAKMGLTGRLALRSVRRRRRKDGPEPDERPEGGRSIRQGGRILRERLRKITRSMHFRVLVILLATGLVPIGLIKNGILRSYERQAYQQRAYLIRSQCSLMAPDFIASDYLTRQDDQVLESRMQQLSDLYQGRVMIINSDYEIIRDSYGLDEGKTVVAQELIGCMQRKPGKYYTQTADFIEVITPIEDTASKEIKGVFLISAPTADIIEGERNMSRMVLALQVILTLSIIGASFYASGILVRPFRKVTDYLNSGEDFLSENLSLPDYTETEMLAGAYNQMRHHLQEQEESRQQFVSNVSHELKTPMTSMKVLSDSLVQQAQMGPVPNEMYAEFMEDISHEIDRENKIITDLLELVKMDRKSSSIHIEETNVNDLINLILKRLRPIAETRGIEISLESYKPILAQVDRTKLTLAISNLIENGIKYNKDHGWVHVSLNVDSTYFYIKVEDSGIGIPLEDQDHIFERFYRVDKSHSREIGGTGLGLAITRSAILVHRGAIRVYSREGEGTTFTVRIPIRYAKPDKEENGRTEEGEEAGT